MSEALSAYHLGEQAVFTSPVNSSTALSTYRLGEKALYTSPNALSLWHFGEKSIVGSATVDSALSAWRQGEKELK